MNKVFGLIDTNFEKLLDAINIFNENNNTFASQIYPVTEYDKEEKKAVINWYAVLHYSPKVSDNSNAHKGFENASLPSLNPLDTSNLSKTQEKGVSEISIKPFISPQDTPSSTPSDKKKLATISQVEELYRLNANFDATKITRQEAFYLIRDLKEKLNSERSENEKRR